jgi:hypothetical protein
MRTPWLLLFAACSACASAASKGSTSDAGTATGASTGNQPDPGSVAAHDAAPPPRIGRPGWKCTDVIPGVACDCNDNSAVPNLISCPPAEEEVCCSCGHTCDCFAANYLYATGRPCEVLAGCTEPSVDEVVCP